MFIKKILKEGNGTFKNVCVEIDRGGNKYADFFNCFYINFV